MNEVTVAGSLAYLKSGVSGGMSYPATQFDSASAIKVESSQAIGASEEALGKGEIGTIGWCMFHNTSADRTITLYSKTGDATSIIAVLAPGKKSGPQYFGGTNIYAVGHADGPVLRFAMFSA